MLFELVLLFKLDLLLEDVLLPLSHLLRFEVLQVVLVSSQEALELRTLLHTLGEDLLARVPSDGVRSDRSHSRSEWLRASWLGSSLLTKLVGPITQHNTFVVAD